MDIRSIKEEDETQVDTLPRQQYHAHDSSIRIYTQTTAFKPKTRSVKTQTLIDATSSFFCEMKQPLSASEWTPEILPANEQSGSVNKRNTKGSRNLRIEQCQCIIVYTMYSSYYYIDRNLVITPIRDSLDVKFIVLYDPAPCAKVITFCWLIFWHI